MKKTACGGGGYWRDGGARRGGERGRGYSFLVWNRVPRNDYANRIKRNNDFIIFSAAIGSSVVSCCGYGNGNGHGNGNDGVI